jgi:hypothetical protein
MNRDSRIYIAGHRGLVVFAIHRELKRLGFSDILARTRDELNLLDSSLSMRSLPRKSPNMSSPLRPKLLADGTPRKRVDVSRLHGLAGAPRVWNRELAALGSRLENVLGN